MMNSSINGPANQSGYIQRSHISPLIHAASAHSSSTGYAPIFVLSQDITDSAKDLLNEICVDFYNRGSINGTEIHEFSLLILLNSDQPLQVSIGQLLDVMRANDGVIYIDDLHRYPYNRSEAFALMERLSEVYQHFPSLCPLVLKMPASIDRQIFSNCPGLYRNCFHLSPEPVYIEDQPTQTGLENSYTAYHAADHQEQHPPQSDTIRQTIPAQESKQRLNQSMPPRREFSSGGGRNIPWYRQDVETYNQEYLGLENYLQSKRMRYRLSAEILPSGRLAIKVRLQFLEIGNCTITVIYDQNFDRYHRDLVLLALSSSDNDQLRTRLAQVKHQYDNEICGHLFDPRWSLKISSYNSAGAAALDAIIRAMI